MECTGLCEALAGAGVGAGLAQYLSLLIGVLLVSGVPLLTVIILIWGERKFAARVQDRIGPNRVGPLGLVQTFADLLKLLFKEDITPNAADRLLYNVSPLLSFATVVLLWAVVPYTPVNYGTDLSIGALYFVAIASLGTLAIMTAGWASNNKYALLGAFRVVALLVSYEVPLVFALLVPVMLAGSMSLLDIIYAQSGMWFAFMSPLALVIFFVSSQAENGRAPFDLIEAESELIAGFNIEYSGMKFGMFFAAEFLHVFTNGVLAAILFLGGWLGLFWQNPVLAFVWLGIKATLLYLISLWIRNTVPRLRIDQVMKFNWFFLVPVSILNLVVVALLLKVMQLMGIAVPLNADTSFISTLPMTLVLLLSNVVIIIAIAGRLRGMGAQSAKRDEVLSAAAAGD